MLLTLLTQTINTIIKDIEPVDVRVATGCLLYSYLNNQDNKIDLRNKALAFKDYYYSQCIEKKITNRTIGFINIEKIVKNKKLQDISTISNSDYENILKWYNVSDLEVKFNPDDLDPRTYGTISFKSNYEKEKFSELHNNYLKPISLYYRNKYNIPYENLQIVSITDSVVPARDVTFFIKDYSSNRIVQDIEQGLILFNKKPSVVRLTTDSFVYIII